MIAPAVFSRSTATASLGATQPLKAGLPQVDDRPSTSWLSFTVIGRPSSARRSPRPSAASAARAVSRARSKSRTTTALIALSRVSMRAMAASVSSSAPTLRPASASTISPAVRSSRSRLKVSDMCFFSLAGSCSSALEEVQP